VPITPTYPGVYIEELPSTVHTIVGVTTSVTAFIGYTKRGPADQATEVFSYGDFERTFGTLDPDCPLTYAVQQFFLNGGSDAWIVRVAKSAGTAAVTIAKDTVRTADVLGLVAASSGTWANPLRIQVDRDTINPDSLFNLTVTEYVSSGGMLVPRRKESFRNLTMNSTGPTNALAVIKDGSKLLKPATNPPVAWPPVAGFATPGDAGYSQSGVLAGAVSVPSNSRLAVSIEGNAPVEITFGPANTPAGIAGAINAALVGAALPASAAAAGNQITITDTTAPVTERSAVRVTPASTGDVSATLKFGVANGGREVDAVAKYSPAQTGTVGADLDASLGGDLPAALDSSGGALKVNVTIDVLGTSTGPIQVTLLEQNQTFASKEALRAGLETALRNAANANPTVAAELSGATVAIAANRIVASAGGRADTTIKIDNAADTTAAKIGFDAGSAIPNVAAYSPVNAVPRLAQSAGQGGADGTPPGATEIIGDDADETGIYALKHVDLFNLLVIPEDLKGNDYDAVMSTAMSYCENRRAFLILDLPTDVNAMTEARDWISASGTPKSANAAAYFPRVDVPDPMQGYRARAMPSAGMIAGLYARIDASRGVWKAPAGTEATLRGPTGVDVPVNDLEQGTLNPLGLNVTRALPIYGNVVWGARTLYGADQLASQWKYIPVRRLALYIEESLFRGTKWAVFEPNDEPLWAQLRLNVGTFMHGLFRQHAFEGASPRQAYLVKCDSETTTQADIDLGVVNILVGFAPLKPAEFVVIQITQLAGQLEV